MKLQIISIAAIASLVAALPQGDAFGAPPPPSNTSTTPPTPTGEVGVAIHPNGDTSKCVDVAGASFGNGTPVQIYDCNGTDAQKFVIRKGQTSVKVANRNFCLDAGSNPGSGIKAKIWQCYDGLPAQNFWYTGDNRIAVTGQGQCLDLTDGRKANGNVLQTWQCYDNNLNQVWNT
ncbi:hypothetical protein E3Q22_04355 [Wallemia mellicola]|uniref:Ricin B lectin domain-containing protein n=2 Tax=Wallemia mellicola TaxID=1708541 RepID=A0A4T0MNC8_9BASI|nr:hypothetical protein WALSEDRAFT_36529 [Wallemia mellicola CBS 633.66]TIB66716.1 hypothetical protein E3Q24_04373 [Wallemia mellicola]EIM22544.1 hypothetical protein WALSEDRAFT_36529 [Wallemia mellicola CBS 633.66]TIB69059.1 hypothetical protein E3Q23_04349 [Wallemia mellicola]TIB73298.1 hypothetical protein E3Q22_04355 [Wallemia mellicola]TIB78375.1 hypothetical protein E3Q21_04397 [Wallemia mellicola]|eukprot:XP_006957214.1 hypothetical protein WALSEDRAFT_36529 [Wallemia mellicola CBS 633.66]